MARLSDAHILITGATSGIGLASAALCLAEGARVTVVGRTDQSCAETLRTLGARTGRRQEVRAEVCDLSRIADVQALVRRTVALGPLDGLVSNAGVQPWTRQLSPDGIELTFATNVLAHYVLVTGLSDALAHSRLKCVVATGSMLHRWGTLDWSALDNPEPFASQKVYARSKAELVLLQTAFAADLAPMGIKVHTFEPGMTRTNFARHFRGFDRFMAKVWQVFMRDPDAVARDIVALFKRDDSATPSAGYWYKGRPKAPAAFATDRADGARLMRYCQSLVNRAAP